MDSAIRGSLQEWNLYSLDKWGKICYGLKCFSCAPLSSHYLLPFCNQRLHRSLHHGKVKSFLFTALCLHIPYLAWSLHICHLCPFHFYLVKMALTWEERCIQVSNTTYIIAIIFHAFKFHSCNIILKLSVSKLVSSALQLMLSRLFGAAW